ncbi:MAG: hypothetical protein MHMPM18_001890 [Marteilia pararefringens]
MTISETEKKWKSNVLLNCKRNSVACEKKNGLIADYLFKEGFLNVTESFLKESGFVSPDNIPKLSERSNINELVLNGEIDAALDILYSHFPLPLLEENPEVLFSLKLQKLIEMVRHHSEITDIIHFAQHNLSNIAINNDMLLEETERVLALAIFEEPFNCPFNHLLDVSQRLKTAKAVNDSILRSNNCDANPKLKTILNATINLQQIMKENSIPFLEIKDLACCTDLMADCCEKKID